LFVYHLTCENQNPRKGIGMKTETIEPKEVEAETNVGIPRKNESPMTSAIHKQS